MDTINSFGGKDAIAEVDVRRVDASLKQLLLNMWRVSVKRTEIFKNVYCCWNENRCLLQNLKTLEGVLQIWLQSGITAKTEHKNHNTRRRCTGTKSPLPATNTQYSTGHRKHVEILRTKHLYIVSGGSHGSTHLVCQQKSNVSAAAMSLNVIKAGASAKNWNANIQWVASISQTLEKHFWLHFISHIQC